MPTSPILYSFRRCPYAMRARMSLVYSGQQVELREVSLKQKPLELLARSPKGTVPVLLCDDGRVLEESLDIMHWALSLCDPEHWLENLAEQQILITENDVVFKPRLDKYKYADRYPAYSQIVYRERCSEFLSMLESRLTNQPFLCGKQIRLADIAIFPFIRQFAHVELDWFEQTAWSNVQRWLNQLKASELFQQAMHKYPVWQTGACARFFPG
jgi:glutathione S-transferase